MAMFNMSVGYDLDGIKTPKIDSFIEGLHVMLPKQQSGKKLFRGLSHTSALLKRLTAAI